MKAKDRIAQLEAELAEVREELDLIEQAETMERELVELKRRIAVKRQPFFISSSGTTGQMSSSGAHLTAVNTQTYGGDDPPDMGVLARVS